MAAKKPNTICKNRDCHRGADGGRRHYYTCRFCAHSENWRSVACCPECYDAYMEQVAAARGKLPQEALLPERTDMTPSEVMELIHDLPTEQVLEETKAELEEEMSMYPDLGIGEIVDLINEELP